MGQLLATIGSELGLWILYDHACELKSVLILILKRKRINTSKPPEIFWIRKSLYLLICSNLENSFHRYIYKQMGEIFDRVVFNSYNTPTIKSNNTIIYKKNCQMFIPRKPWRTRLHYGIYKDSN